VVVVAVGEEAEVAAGVAVEDLAVAVVAACGPAADFRPRAVCRAPARRLVPVRVQERGRVAVRWLVPDRAEVRLVLGPAALRVQERGQALRVVELPKVVRGLVELVPAALVKVARAPAADCQDKVLAQGSAREEPADRVAISPAVAQTLANSTTSSTSDPQPAQLELAEAWERARPDVQVLARCPAARDVQAARQPISCKAVAHRSCPLVAQHWAVLQSVQG
jgi:hypothetical protein